MIHFASGTATDQSFGIAYWVCFAVALVSALTSLAFSIAALRTPAGGIYARYAAGRSISLVVGVVVAVALASPIALFVAAIVMTVVQAADAVVGILDKDRMKTVGPLVLALLTLAAAIWLAVEGLAPEM